MMLRWFLGLSLLAECSTCNSDTSSRRYGAVATTRSVDVADQPAVAARIWLKGLRPPRKVACVFVATGEIVSAASVASLEQARLDERYTRDTGSIAEHESAIRYIVRHVGGG